MAILEYQITELKHAYQVLGVPLSASAPSIKRNYRNLIKRWHPDLYPNGTQDYSDATQMTKLLNAAYSSIGDAPLRYYIEACPPAYVGSRQAANPSPGTRVDSILKTGWLEFWIRFVFGAGFGALVGFRAFIYMYGQEDVFIFGTIGLMLVFGVAAAMGGDNFWHSFFRRWWFWW